MEYYSAIKNTFESDVIRCMRLEPIIQSEVSQKEKYQYIASWETSLQVRKQQLGLDMEQQNGSK